MGAPTYGPRTHVRRLRNRVQVGETCPARAVAEELVADHLDAPRASRAKSSSVLAGKNYEAAHATWTEGRWTMPQPGYPTCTAHNHSVNAALQTMITNLPLDENGKLTDLSTLRNSWLTDLVPSIREQQTAKIDRDPYILLDMRSSTCYLVLARMKNYAVVCWELVQAFDAADKPVFTWSSDKAAMAQISIISVSCEVPPEEEAPEVSLFPVRPCVLLFLSVSLHVCYYLLLFVCCLFFVSTSTPHFQNP